jgi:hypothetical protein
LLLSSTSASKYPGYGLLILAHTPSDNRALLSLNISNNKLTSGAAIPGREGWSDDDDDDDEDDDEAFETDMTGIVALANVIPNMRALSKFTFSGDQEDSKPVTMETCMVEADFGGKSLGESGAIMAAAFLPKCM